jgi:hypothetical protein
MSAWACFAYWRFGEPVGPSIVLLQHFTGKLIRQREGTLRFCGHRGSELAELEAHLDALAAAEAL